MPKEGSNHAYFQKAYRQPIADTVTNRELRIHYHSVTHSIIIITTSTLQASGGMKNLERKRGAIASISIQLHQVCFRVVWWSVKLFEDPYCLPLATLCRHCYET